MWVCVLCPAPVGGTVGCVGLRPAHLRLCACRERASTDLWAISLSLSIGTSWAWKGPREDARYDASSRVSCGGRTRDQEGKRLGGMAKGRYSEILSEIFESFEFAAASYSLRRACIHGPLTPPSLLRPAGA